jgi:PAS domain S-box-containing protein
LAFENITARKRIETQLQESQHYNQQIAETMPGILFVHDLIEQRNVYTNRQILELLGYSSEQVRDMGADALPMLIHPDDLERVFSYFESFRSVPEGAVLGIEYRAHHANGEWRWMYSQSVVFNRTAAGLPRQILGVSIDISDRIQAELGLQESEARLKLAYRATRSGLWDWDINRNRAYISEEYCALFGLDPTTQEVSYEKWLSLLHPDDHTIAIAAVRRAIVQQEYEVNYRILHPDGIRWIASRGQVFYDAAGNAIRMLGNVQDITERKRVEDEREHLLARERYYINQLQGLTTAALAITNSALSVEQVLQVITHQAASIIGAHQSVTSLTINQNWAQAINAVYLSDKYAQWQDYDEKTDGSGIYACVCHLNRPIRMTQAELEAHPHWQGFGKAADKHPPMRGWLAAPLVGRDGHDMGLIQLSDKYEGEFTAADESILVQLAQMASVAVENARLYEAERQARSAAEASREEAEAANRIKDEFLAVLSHELRSPLNPILGWSRLLQGGKLDATKTAHALETIERNAKLQTQLIDDLLDVSRILQGKLNLNIAPINLVSTIESAIETVRLAAEAKSIQIHTKLDPGTGQVLGDSARLQQIVWNLLSNAVKFTPAGGRVEVQLERVIGHSASVMGDELGQSPILHYAQITVSDTGKGIHPDFLPHVFEYFRQADATTTRTFGGLGLGLAIVRHLVELHGGTVQADSPEGLGAIFTVRLPLMGRGRDGKTESWGETHSLSPSPLHPLSGLQILVVDDDPDSREFVVFLLEQAGASILSTTSASQALTLLTQSRPDILLSDIGMPEMDGYMLMQQVRALPPEQGGQIPAIALTAYAGEFNEKQALAAGFQQHVSKPVEPEGLVKAIVTLLRKPS